MKKVLSIIVLLVISASIYAQKITEASNLEKKNATSAEVDPVVQNAIKSEQEFKEIYKWLMETPINEQEERRQMVNASISNYIEQNSKIQMELDVKLLKFAETSPQLLPIFMSGYTIYMFENQNANPVQANVAGIESVIEYYKKNETYLEKDKNVEKFIRKEEKDKLDNFVERKSKPME